MKKVIDPKRSRRVRVRYAPSPTGIPHIGNIRTALYNYLFARNRRGNFLLRIEDTDRARLIPESVAKIKESLKLLGLIWDEEEQQSKRLDIYKKHLDILKAKKAVYEQEGAWYFRVPKAKKLSWTDVVHGEVEFSSDVMEDFVVIKSDNFPTYHFASVVDDHDMQITHVMRGDEWISSTPKHLLIYHAFNWQPPAFVHLPPILGHDKKKLSKREGAKSTIEYINEGYLPEAIVNFLALLGWSPPPSVAQSEGGKREKELFTLDELIKDFSLDRLNKNSPIFNIEKLNWFNKKYLQKLSNQELAERIKRFYSKTTSSVILEGSALKAEPDRIFKDSITHQKLLNITDLVRDRMTTLADFDNIAKIFFEKGREKPPEKSKIENAKSAIESITDWNEQSISQSLDRWIEANNLQPGDFKNTLRLSVFADNTPPIYQSLAVLTKDEVKNRINDAIKKSR